jgi:hypothetical protein
MQYGTFGARTHYPSNTVRDVLLPPGVLLTLSALRRANYLQACSPASQVVPHLKVGASIFASGSLGARDAHGYPGR